MVRLLCFAGSLRRASLNKQLAALAAERARALGAEVTLVDLKDFPLPVYDGDLEEESGIPEHGVRLKELFVAHDGLLLSCPEYNSSITGALKNAIDWVSRPASNEPPLVAFRGKTAALLAASPGALGGLRGLVTVRSILGNLGVIVVPSQLAVPRAHEVLKDGALTDPGQDKSLARVVQELVETTDKLKA
ncbi:MAG: NADPH-dependent FMN reductase [Planctomycetota bacterium]